MQNLSMMKEALPSVLHFAILTREKADTSKKADNNSANKKDPGMFIKYLSIKKYCA